MRNCMKSPMLTSVLIAAIVLLAFLAVLRHEGRALRENLGRIPFLISK